MTVALTKDTLNQLAKAFGLNCPHITRSSLRRQNPPFLQANLMHSTL